MLLELLYMKFMKILSAVFKLLYAARDRDRHGEAKKQIIIFFLWMCQNWLKCATTKISSDKKYKELFYIKVDN